MDEVSSYVRLDLPLLDGKAAQKIVPPRHRIPWWKGLGADSEEKRDPASDINTRVVESLKVLDPNRPIREANIVTRSAQAGFIHKRWGNRTAFWWIAEVSGGCNQGRC